jgi:hypothetical protein
MKVIKVKFYGIDSFCRPIFKALNGRMYFGSTAFLFRTGTDEKEIIKFFKERPEELVYFGNKFDCEPYGLHVSEFKEPSKLEIVFDSDDDYELEKILGDLIEKVYGNLGQNYSLADIVESVISGLDKENKIKVIDILKQFVGEE